jgi:hypothetical protein
MIMHGQPAGWPNVAASKSSKDVIGSISLWICAFDPEQTRSEPRMIVPDSLYGAFLLSIIDFFLSIVMITGIGVVLALFPLLNRLGKLDEQQIRKSSH